MAKDLVYCDNCGDLLVSRLEQHWYAELPWDIDSANAGESGVLCDACVEYFEKDDVKCPTCGAVMLATWEGYVCSNQES